MDVTHFALIMITAISGNDPGDAKFPDTTIEVFAGNGSCSFREEDAEDCSSRVTTLISVNVGGKVVAEIPSSVIPKDALPLIYHELNQPKAQLELMQKIRKQYLEK